MTRHEIQKAIAEAIIITCAGYMVGSIMELNAPWHFWAGLFVMAVIAHLLSAPPAPPRQ